MVVKPSLGFLSSDSDAQLVKDAQSIVTSMTNNPSYPAPTPTLAAVTTAINDFSTALDNSADGGRTLTLLKNQKRAALNGLLRNLASYVHMSCNGDLATLSSSGFPTQKPVRTPVGPLPTPSAPTLSHGDLSGELDAATTSIPNAAIYNWRVALESAPDTYVALPQTTAAYVTVKHLIPGESYLVDVNVVGSAGPTAFSDTAQLIVV